MAQLLIFLSGVVVTLAVPLFSPVSGDCHRDGDVDITWKNMGGREINIAMRGETIRKKNSNYPTHTVPHYPSYKNVLGAVEWEKNIPVITLHAYGEALLHLAKCEWIDWFREGDRSEGKYHWTKSSDRLEIFSDENPPRVRFIPSAEQFICQRD